MRCFCMCWGLQELGMDLLWFCSGLTGGTLKTLALVCLGGTYPVEVAVRACQLVQLRAQRVEPGDYLSFLLALLLGSAFGVTPEDSWQRHEANVTAACAALHAYGNAGATFCVLFFPVYCMCVHGLEPPCRSAC